MKIAKPSELSTFSVRAYLSMHDVKQAFINTIVASANSSIGFFHLYNESTQEISLGVWSNDVSSFCELAHDNH